MKILSSHRIECPNELNNSLVIQALDEPSNGGAHHLYVVYADEAGKWPSPETVHVTLKFQQGGVAEVGVNGISNEALLAIVVDRMKGFQAGPFACRENAVALTHLETAILWLGSRTRERTTRGVEGRLQP